MASSIRTINAAVAAVILPLGAKVEESSTKLQILLEDSVDGTAISFCHSF